MLIRTENVMMCLYLCLRFDVVYIGLCFSSCWGPSMVD